MIAVGSGWYQSTEIISEIYKPPCLEDISWNVLVYEVYSSFGNSKISDQSAKCKGEVEVIVLFNYRGERDFIAGCNH